MDTSRDPLTMASRASKSAMSAQEEDLMQLTLQLRNKKENDKNAKFHGDNLIGVCERPCSSNSLLTAQPESNLTPYRLAERFGDPTAAQKLASIGKSHRWTFEEQVSQP